MPPAAAPEEYDLALPGAGGSESGSGDGSSESTAPLTAPVAPALAPTEIETTGGKRNRKRDRPEGPTDPILTTSGVNATAGPQEIPTLKIEDDDEGGAPTLALVLASVAAACCILALWRLRFLRELPAAPRPRAPRAETSS